MYKLVNEKGKILKKEVNINRLKPFKCQLSQCDPDSATQPPELVKVEKSDVSSCDDESGKETPAIRINHSQCNPDSGTQPRKK